MDGGVEVAAAEIIALYPEKTVNQTLSLKDRISHAGCKAVERVAAALFEKEPGMDLEELSNKLLTHSREITGAMLSAYLDARSADPAERLAHPCPGCGKRLPCYESRSRSIETRHGTIIFERPYFHCPACKQGYFPMDDDLRLAAKAKQHDLGRVALGGSSIQYSL